MPVPDRLAEQLSTVSTPGETASEQTRGQARFESLDFLAPSERPDSLGRLAHYEILKVIGAGGMGIVFKAFDEQLHRMVAIKMMPLEMAASSTARQRFIREARAAAAITHEHVVTIHAVEGGHRPPYLAMQFVDGVSLQQKLDQRGALRVPEILRIGLQTAQGLMAAHAQGVVHRDIKPANILLENGVERVKISDFGLAHVADEANVTQAGVIAGTPQYMAPEQALADPVDHRADLFSLGSVLYAMCTGHSPFAGGNTITILKRLCEDEPPRIREINPEIPEWLAGIVGRLLAKNPHERFQSASEVAEVLEQHLAHVQHPSAVPLPVIVAPKKKKPRIAAASQARPAPTHRLPMAIVAVALLCLLVSLGLAEATGVTQLSATVIRIFTSSGTLVVEVDDPQVHVTIEGDGGLSITGAGPQEVRLRPGKYQVEASKDGKPVSKRLVEITRGDRKVVAVTHERPAQPVAQSAAQPATGVPQLLVPAAGALLPNGTLDRTKIIVWEFSWAGVPEASRYHLVVVGPNAAGPLIEIQNLSKASYRYTNNSYVGAHLSGWRWRVRAMVAGTWMPWSEERTFDVQPAASPAAQAGPKPFVVLKRDNGSERTFETLADAVLKSTEGDTIEIRGNGPFTTEPIRLSSRLTIRAGQGFRPVIKATEALAAARSAFLLDARAPLILEGLEFQAGADSSGGECVAVNSLEAPIHVANCRFTRCELMIQRPPICQVRNSQLSTAAMSPVVLFAGGTARSVFDNNIVATHALVGRWVSPIALAGGEQSRRIELTRNNLLGGNCGIALSSGRPRGASEEAPPQLHSSRNIVDGRGGVLRFMAPDLPPDSLPTSPQRAELEGLLRQVVVWREEQNLYPAGAPLLALAQGRMMKPIETTHSCPTLDEWNQFWGLTDTASIRGVARFQGGDLVYATPETCTPADFRLRPDSAGYRAGPDGKDLGPDIDLVGPGEAYERWKQTPEYQTWLKETQQAGSGATTTSQPPAGPPTPNTAERPIAILSASTKTERTFASLNEALPAARSGDVIEIRGNGPFPLKGADPIAIPVPVTIRAGQGFRPVIRLDQGAALSFDAPAILEGLEFQRAALMDGPAIFGGRSANQLYIANCRFTRCGVVNSALSAEIRNSQIFTTGNAVHCPSGIQRVVLNGNIIYSPATALHVATDGNGPISLEIQHNTIVSGRILDVAASFAPNVAPQHPVQARASFNVACANNGVILLIHTAPAAQEWITAQPSDVILRQTVAWQEERNVYPQLAKFYGLNADSSSVPLSSDCATLGAWQQLWGLPETGSIQESLWFGDAVRKRFQQLHRDERYTLEPEDFRLAAGSAGGSAGPEGRALGADLDLVGPGEAYERWKQTPAYLQWLKYTGQPPATASERPFVLLAGSSRMEQTFATLAEAVNAAASGGTIEIRGNGPFTSDRILSSKALTIRAAAGFTPVLRVNPESPFPQLLSHSGGPLVLEGLEIQRLRDINEKSNAVGIIICLGGRVHVTNCRFVLRHREGGPLIDAYQCPVCDVRNCQFLDGPRDSAVKWRGPARSQVLLKNNLVAGDYQGNSVLYAFAFGRDDLDASDISIGLVGNTLVGRSLGCQFTTPPFRPNLTDQEISPAAPPFHVEAVGNVIDVPTGVVDLHMSALPTGAKPAATLQRMLTWHDERNLYAQDGRFFSVRMDGNAEPSLSLKKTLTDWQQFWGQTDSASLQGVIRYQGGNLATRLASEPQSLTPEDFRLAQGSAGKGAGENGKDLGADVDLVGPGAAYERWKKTPAYQQWLNETGQAK
jgi:hypothetical protein